MGLLARQGPFSGAWEEGFLLLWDRGIWNGPRRRESSGVGLEEPSVAPRGRAGGQKTEQERSGNTDLNQTQN